jgi:hypothetical protein
MRYLMLFLLGCFAPLMMAQSQEYTTTSAVPTWHNPVMTFEITAQSDMVVRSVGAAMSAWAPTPGEPRVEVWVRSGGMGTYPPTAPTLHGWDFAGAAFLENVTGVILQIPIELGISLQPNEKLGICIVRSNGRMLLHNSSQMVNPPIQAHMTVNASSYAGSYSASSTPPFMTYYPSSMVAYTTIWYDAGPTIATSTSSVALAPASAGSHSPVESYTVSGYQLSAPTQIVASSQIEISFNQNSGFGSSLTIPGYPNYPAQTIYVRSRNNVSSGLINAVIEHTSQGSPSRNVTVSGNVIALSSNTTSLNLGTTIIGYRGAHQSYQLNGTGLTTSTTITAPNGFEIALSASGPYSQSRVITALAYSQNVYVRMTGASLGVQNGFVTNTSGPGTVSIAVSGEVVPPDNLMIDRKGPNQSAFVDSNHEDPVVLLDFTMQTYASAWDVSSITFGAFGTANADTAFEYLALHRDNGNGQFDGSEPMVTINPGTGFINGQYVAELADSEFPTYQTPRFFLVGKLAGNATVDQTIRVEVIAVDGTTNSPGTLMGVPTAGTSAAVTVNPSLLFSELLGPNAYQTVQADSQGPDGNGHVVFHFTLRSSNDYWNVQSLVFRDRGSINGHTAFNSLELYMDDGNGIWDGPSVDTLATVVPGTRFDAPNGYYNAVLTPEAADFGVHETKEFFLVARLNGTATPGQTVKVSLADIIETSPGNGEVIGRSSAPTSALVVNMATLTVAAGPGNPAGISLPARDESVTQVIGQLRLTASLSSFAVNGLNLTTGGSGDWANDITEVRIYRENGNGILDPNDQLVYSGLGAEPGVQAVFSPAVTVPANSSVDFWVLVDVKPGVGSNPASSFTMEVASPSDVLVSGDVFLAFGTKPPVCAELRMVDFKVTSFSPSQAGLKGGNDIVIEGSGFALPVVLRIGGVVAQGDAVVNAEGTMITGLKVPEGGGSDLPIVLQTNQLEPITLSQTFNYTNRSSAGSGSSDSGAGCVGAMPAAPLALLLPAALSLLALRRRRNA